MRATARARYREHVHLTFAVPIAAPTPDPSTSPGVSDSLIEESEKLLTSLFTDTSEQLIGLAVLLGILVVAWFVGRAVIRGITAGIERGTPFNDPRTRRALRKARIAVPEPDTIELRLEADRRAQRADTLRRVLNSSLAVLLITIGVATTLTVLGVPVGPMLASAGVVGVALGFGAQSLVKDVLSGLFMLVEDQYGVGDVVNLGEATGTVEEVGLRCTRLRSIDGTVWYVPNGQIIRVGNMTRMWSRALVEVRFAYDTDVEAARKAMLDAVEAARASSPQVADSILGEPEVAGVESLEYNAVMLRLLVQVNASTQWDVQREIRRELRRILAERGIDLAVPGEAMVVEASRQAPRREPVAPESPGDEADAPAGTAPSVTEAPDGLGTATTPAGSGTAAAPSTKRKGKS